jgi:hypothetical protein
MSLAWTASDVAGQGNLTYTLSSIGSSSGTYVIATGATSPFIEPGLPVGTLQQYQLTVTDALGDTKTATAAGTTYQLPTLTVSGAPVSASSINVSWTGTDNAAQGALTYSLSRGTSVFNNVTSPFTDTGLAAGVQYGYTLTATDAVGDSRQVQTFYYTDPTPLLSLSVGAVTPSSVTLNYSATDLYGAGPGSGPGISQVNFYKNGTLIGSSNTPAASFTAGGLSPNTTYSFSAIAYDTANDPSASSVVSATTSVPVYTDTPVMTEGFVSITNYIDRGFIYQYFGAMSPTTTLDGKAYFAFHDQLAPSPGSQGISLSGLAADPGQAWLVSASAHGVTKMGATATYSFANNTASWVWTGTPFGFTGTGTTTCTIIHK